MNKRFDIDSIVNNAIKNTTKQGAAEQPETVVKKTKAPRQFKSVNMERYDDVTNADWASLPLGRWYRYEADGVLKAGGILQSIANTTDNEFLFTFVARMYGRSSIWRVNSKNVTRLYKTKDEFNKNTETIETKTEPEVTGSSNVLDRIGDKLLFTDTEMLRGQIESLDKRITNIESNISKIVKFLKKINLQEPR